MTRTAWLFEHFTRLSSTQVHRADASIAIQGIFICIIQAVAAAVLPALTFLWVGCRPHNIYLQAFPWSRCPTADVQADVSSQ